MKLYINGLDLAYAVNKVSRALPNREVSPVLECIKFVAREDKVILFATDKDLSIEVVVPATVVVGGSILVPGKIFAEYIKLIATEENIEIETQENTRMLVNDADRSQSVFNCMDITMYPNIETATDLQQIVVSEGSLRDLINNVIFSVSTDDGKPLYKGINFTAKEYTLTAVATDGYRFALCKRAMETSVEKISAVAPARSMGELAKILGDGDENAKVEIGKNNMIVTIGDTKLITRLLTEGNYINYETVIPTEFESTVIVDRERMLKSLHTVYVLARQDQLNLINMNIEEYKMTLSASREVGHAKEELPIVLIGKDVKSSFNAKYINDCLKTIDGENIKLEFNNISCCVITKENCDDVLYFVLPRK